MIIRQRNLDSTVKISGLLNGNFFPYWIELKGIFRSGTLFFVVLMIGA